MEVALRQPIAPRAGRSSPSRCLPAPASHLSTSTTTEEPDMKQHDHSRRQFLLVLLAAGAFAAGTALGGLPVAAQGQGAAARTPLRIGIIGSGRQGGALGLQWAKAGHEIFFS